MTLDHINGPEVQKVYSEQENYFIIKNDAIEKQCTVVYFSSNGLYFPNTIDCFTNTILKNNRFEWMNKNNQIKFATKSIFVRDVFKQWYLKGINSEIDNLDKLITFIKEESAGTKLICVGSSAGGYAATLIGSILNSEAVFCFSGQLSLLPIFEQGKNQIVNECYEKWKQYYNLESFIEKTVSNIFYFSCADSKIDFNDMMIASKYSSIHPFLFKCSAHGIPFRAYVLQNLLSTSEENLITLSKAYGGRYIVKSVFEKTFFSIMGYYYSYMLYASSKIHKIPKYIMNKFYKG